jgi:UDP-galactopyranose mutase
MAQWLIVGSGFTGAVLAEQIASKLGETVLVIDRRDHIAGNAYDYVDENGIIVHKYGPHIFHTNSKKIWDYLSSFTAWRPYYHHVLATVEGRQVPLPFNLNSIAALFPPYLADLLCRKLISSYGFGKKVPILRLRETDDKDLRFLAEYIYEHVFETYTMKQWALRPEDLDPGVTARVPVYISRDDRYFQDTYQAMPKEGYTKLFERMMEHDKIQILLNAEYKAVRLQYPHSKVVYTGPIDEYFDYAHGPLPYRGMKFVSDYKSVERAQAAGTVNFPNDFDFTRITEMKWLTGQTTPATVLVEEYPKAYEPGQNEPYYPIPTLANAEKLRPYQALAAALSGQVWFAGRLGDYAYYNMDQACGRALALFEKSIAKSRDNCDPM